VRIVVLGTGGVGGYFGGRLAQAGESVAFVARGAHLEAIRRDGLRVERSGVDRIAEITAKDTPGAYQLGRVSLTFPSPVTHSAVVAMIAGQLGLVVGGIMIPADVTLAQGGTFFGAATQFLDRIAATTNCDWWISDGVFFFVGKGAPAPGASAPVFSSLAGNLIGTPIKRDRGKVEVKALLDATMRPGLTFSVVSESIKGSFIADSVEFTGDSGYDQPFYVRVIGRPPGT